MTTARTVTAVYVGTTGAATHAVEGAHSAAGLREAKPDTLCGAVARGLRRNGRRAPELELAPAGYGITCAACKRSL